MNRGGGTAFFFLFLATALGLFVWWRWTRPLPGETSSPLGHHVAPGYPADPSEASRLLVEALHERLEKSDFLKLLDEPVQSGFDFASGDKVRTYREVYRLPERVEPQRLASELSDAAESKGATLLGAVWKAEKNGDSVYDCRFGFPPDWAPVTVGFRKVSTPRLAVVIDDAGYTAGNTLDGFWKLKVPATVAVIPGLEFSTRIAEGSPSRGWEVICHMPMEGHEAVADGAYRWILKKTTHPGEVTDTLTGALSGLPNCRGMNNHMGSRATEDRDLMLQVGHFLRSRDMFFLDSRTSDKTVAYPAVREAGVPSVERNVFLDNEEDLAAIERQLAKAVARAKKKGTAVTIGHFRRTTLEALAKAVPGIKAQGVKFVYLSELVH